MKKFSQVLAVLVFWALIVPAAWADNSKMTHIVFRIIDPSVPEGHFGLAPKEVWRLGNRYMRLEEVPDPERGIHGLILVDEPHIFMINSYDNRGTHILDPDPTFEVHMPIFSFPKASDISKLEFGHEWEFFSQRKARQMPHVKVGGVRYKSFMLETDGGHLVLFTDEKTGHPAQVAFHSDQASHVIRYDTYEAGLEPNMNLFKVPAGVVITEAKQ